MQVSEIRAKYWKLATTLDSLSLDKTAASRIQMLQAEMLTEIAANLAEINETLKRSVGLVNFEELGLQLTVLLEKVSNPLVPLPAPAIREAMVKERKKENESGNKPAGSQS